MLLRFRSISLILAAGLVQAALSFSSKAQTTGAVTAGNKGAATTAAQLPDAPEPQSEVASAEPPDQQFTARQDKNTSQQNSGSAQTQGSSSSQSPPQQSGSEKSQHEKAAEQLKAEEKQRVMGVMATFNTTRNPNAIPLSPAQKYQLYFRSVIDPWAFSLSAAVAGVGQADDSTPEWGQGIKGYSKRFGAGYSDYAMGNFFGNALLPSLWHEDPRYYQKGSGPVMTRVLWAASTTVWCKRDRGGWGPNWGNVIGNLIGSSIARAYYPAADRTVGGTITDGLTVTYEGIIGAEVIEFWPDMVRHYQLKKAKKEARREAKAAASAH